VQPVSDWQQEASVAAPVVQEPVFETIPYAAEEPVAEHAESAPAYAEEQSAYVYEPVDTEQSDAVMDDTEAPVSDETDEKI
jgi:hypothetical protein